MIKMKPYIPSRRIAIRESIDEELSDDVDDDVFIKDSRSIKLNEEGLRRPLMSRRKNRSQAAPIMKKHPKCWRCCEPFCYGLAALTVLIAIISLAAFILTMFPVPLQRIKKYDENLGTEFVPCTQISVQKLWSRTFPQIQSESPIRKADLNGDGVDDIIFGFGVDDNIQYEGIALPKCKSPQLGEDVPCEGGLIALNGTNGDLIWQIWSVANVFSLLCDLDINADGYKDCVAAGRLGMIFAVDGQNGNNLWEFREIEIETNSPIVMDLYTINIIRDLDGDDIPDIIAVHLEEREASKAGHLKLISGKTGKVIRQLSTPFREEAFVQVQLITEKDGTEVLLVVTGGQNTPGGVYSIRLLSLMQYKAEFIPLFRTNNHSGIMVPAIITDINGDNNPDIIVSSFNASVYAFDGHDYSMIWNFTFPESESVSSIVPGHFNHDDVADFMVKYNMGPGFPVYYYGQTMILDGKTGKPLLNTMMTDAGGSSSLLGGITISQTFGGDFFLHWQMQCRDKYDAKDAYTFIPDSDIILQARADTCRLRYNTSSVVKLYAISRHLESPGAVIFSTDDLEVHLNRTQRIHSRYPHAKSPLKHPKMLKKLLVNRDELLKKTATATVESELEPFNKDQSKQLRSQFKENVIDPFFEKNNLPRTGHQTTEMLPELHSYNRLLEGYNAAANTALRDYVNMAAAQAPPDDYETIYNDNSELPEPISPQQNESPIRLRSKYPGMSNRDIRSDIVTTLDDNDANDTNILLSMSVPHISLVGKQEEPLSLWDLELEKEQRDAINAAQKFAQIPSSKNKLKKRKAKRENSEARTPKATEKPSPNNGDELYLASISSTGVLLKSLTNTRSSNDFAFILNIRESETYPPLFLKQDLSCVEDKINAYKLYTLDNLRLLKKQFLKQCLNERLVNVTASLPNFESQLVVTRLGISCTCRNLRPGEVCSELEDIKSQRWTQFMGNEGYGYY